MCAPPFFPHEILPAIFLIWLKSYEFDNLVTYGLSIEYNVIFLRDKCDSHCTGWQVHEHWLPVDRIKFKFVTAWLFSEFISIANTTCTRVPL